MATKYGMRLHKESYASGFFLRLLRSSHPVSDKREVIRMPHKRNGVTDGQITARLAVNRSINSLHDYVDDHRSRRRRETVLPSSSRPAEVARTEINSSLVSRRLYKPDQTGKRIGETSDQAPGAKKIQSIITLLSDQKTARETKNFTGITEADPGKYKLSLRQNYPVSGLKVINMERGITDRHRETQYRALPLLERSISSARRDNADHFRSNNTIGQKTRIISMNGFTGPSLSSRNTGHIANPASMRDQNRKIRDMSAGTHTLMPDYFARRRDYSLSASFIRYGKSTNSRTSSQTERRQDLPERGESGMQTSRRLTGNSRSGEINESASGRRIDTQSGALHVSNISEIADAVAQKFGNGLCSAPTTSPLSWVQSTPCYPGVHL